MAFFQAPFGVLEALLTIYLSRAVVSAVTQALEPLAVLAQTALIGAALLLCACVKNICTRIWSRLCWITTSAII